MKTRFSHRLKPWEMLPDQAFGAAVAEGGGYPPVEARIIWLRLPIWGFEYNGYRDEFAWGQRVLVYNGRSGFSTFWRFE